LSEYLGCFNKNEHIYLGERYGFNLFNEGGFNYITGGGGIVFNLKTLKLLVKKCSCPAKNSPDDMIFGACLKSSEIDPIHSSLFHQARSNDYPLDAIDNNSISFHKFWLIDPFEVYQKWFQQQDKKYYKLNKEILSDCKNTSKINRKQNQKIEHVDL
jgi:UDP-glucose:O-linked fucose beta-1,3-glucosyltransferase